MIALRHLCAISLLIVVSACGGERRQEAEQLVVSIRPLALIAREITGPEMPIQVLIETGDPHHYAPRVADRAHLERAQLVLWMGPELETALAQQMENLPAGRRLQLLNAGEYEYEGAALGDPHLWLRPRNAALMAGHIAERLAQLQPEQAEVYRERARDFSREAANQQKVLERALWAYRQTRVVATHDAYGHLFGPAGVASRGLADSSFSQRGARTLLELRSGEGGCLFGEVPENDRDRQLADNLGMHYAALDPLGTRLPPNARYRDLIDQLLADVRSCPAQAAAR